MKTTITCYAAYVIADGIVGQPEIFLGRFSDRADAQFAIKGANKGRVEPEEYVIFNSIHEYNEDHRNKLVAQALAKLDANEQAYLREHWHREGALETLQKF